ncbi:hypothetical protein [Sphingomonas hengshuiensis]|uniref:Uncharacterized protein n=1 Tax=Sphingomonas hengshuiensis TaxID=1609977 RepID=A0A7U4J9Z6_9SPHN|nr:hypothetical protein [Sphingomonas hengshuiensis]AJP72963.1 hypothetical protein TS85_15935 [Sphingomonas hengshuiensis]
MSNPMLAAPGLLLLLAAPATAPQPRAWADAGDGVQQHASIHVPRLTVTTTTVILREARRPALVEKKADDCVKMDKLAGFSVNRFDSVDLVLKDGSLLRAKLGSDCPSLGFYSGFYVKPNRDKKICAKRDALRTRSGRVCSVLKFAALVPQR